MTKDKGGRPPVITKKVLSKLDEGFSFGLSDNEACLYANIAPATFYRYLKKNKKYKERKELLKDRPKMQAKLNITKSINSKGKADKFQREINSKWYLERKDRSFSAKQETEMTAGGEPIKKVVFEFQEAKHANLDEDGEKIEKEKDK